MKILNHWAKRLTSNRGELLAETIISFMLLALLMSMIAILVRGAMLMTNSSIENAKISQEDEINPAIMEDYSSSLEKEFKITATLPAGLSDIDTEHDIEFNTFCATFPACADGCNDEIAFSPKAVP
jgi:hypothetical protein